MIFLKVPWHKTPQEKEEQARRQAEAKYQRELLKRQKQEAAHLQRQIPAYLARMEICYRKKKNEKDFFESDVWPVRLDKAQIGEDAYYFHIDTKRLPRGVFLHHLRDEKTLETLTAACGSKVEFHETQLGYWYAVETRYGRGAIPVQVGYGEMIQRMAAAADPLSFPLGMGANQKAYTGDMDEMINLLVGGTKGGGKSNLINVMLCTLISRNDPAKLRLFLTDLKGGLEFIDYAGLPHLGGDVGYVEKTTTNDKGRHSTYKAVDQNYKPKEGEEVKPPMGGQIATEPHQVLPVLRYCEAEMDRRTKMMAGKAKKIASYNKRFKAAPLSYWLVVIDELATLMENKKYAPKATASLSELARKGRAVGIYIVLATQTPSSAIVPQQIANNMDSRAAFRTGSGVASGILLGDGKYDAAHLPNIPGRFIWKWGGESIELQAPLIADTTVKKVVAEAKRGGFTDPKSAERAQKAEFLFTFALANLKGECNSKTLYSYLRPHNFTQKEVFSILEDYEARGEPPGIEPEIELNGDVYYLASADMARKISRWLVPAGDYVAGRHPHPDYVSSFRVSGFEQAPDPVDPESSKPSNPESAETPPEVTEPPELQELEALADELANEAFRELTELEPETLEPITPKGKKAPGSRQKQASNGKTAPTAKNGYKADVPAWVLEDE